MQAAVVVFPGTNREGDAVKALTRATGHKPHIVWHGDSELPKVDLVVLPGGFSYGDYLRTGAMAAHSPIMREVAARAKKGMRVWGICNGFQVLCEAGLLPGILLRNSQLRFVCRPVTLQVEQTDSDFTRLCQSKQQLKVIVAHGDGNYFVEPEPLKQMEAEGQIAFRYKDNPNGSLQDIAGVFNRERNVLGMMPHPENAIEPLHGSSDGAVLFESIAATLAA
jgi:phosphoribosylformylglycinamidine synthase